MTAQDIHAHDPHELRQEREKARAQRDGDHERAQQVATRAARSARRTARIKQQQRATK